jgi:guanine nucleotide-binding protein subunit alpha
VAAPFLQLLDDMKLAEDAQTNRMQESLQVFKQLSQSQWLQNIPFLLFLNKCDLLKEKIQSSPINKWFPDFTGDNSNYNEVVQFIENKYRAAFSGKTLYKPWITCALDTEYKIYTLNTHIFSLSLSHIHYINDERKRINFIL